MKQTIDLYDFINAFRAREGRYEQLGGHEGLSMLFDHLEDLERSEGEEYELDVIGLCCDYACSTVEDILIDYGQEIEIPVGLDYDTPRNRIYEVYDAIEGFLENHTIVVGVLDDGRILYRQF